MARLVHRLQLGAGLCLHQWRRRRRDLRPQRHLV